MTTTTTGSSRTCWHVACPTCGMLDAYNTQFAQALLLYARHFSQPGHYPTIVPATVPSGCFVDENGTVEPGDAS